MKESKLKFHIHKSSGKKFPFDIQNRKKLYYSSLLGKHTLLFVQLKKKKKEKSCKQKYNGSLVVGVKL